MENLFLKSSLLACCFSLTVGCSNTPVNDISIASIVPGYVLATAPGGSAKDGDLVKEYQLVKEGAGIKFKEHAELIKSLKQKVQSDNKVNRAKLELQLHELDETNSTLQTSIENYQSVSDRKWRIYKKNFDKEMQELDQAIAEMSLNVCTWVTGL